MVFREQDLTPQQAEALQILIKLHVDTLRALSERALSEVPTEYYANPSSFVAAVSILMVGVGVYHPEYGLALLQQVSPDIKKLVDALVASNPIGGQENDHGT